MTFDTSVVLPLVSVFVIQKYSGGKKNSERSDYNPLDKLEAGEPFDTESSH
jgi:hypothetical protein